MVEVHDFQAQGVPVVVVFVAGETTQNRQVRLQPPPRP